MRTFDASMAQWLTAGIKYSRETLEVRARNSEKSSWRRAINLRKTKQVDGLPGAIPGQMRWGNAEHRISFGWKSILPIPSGGIGLHARDEKGVYLICTSKDCSHGGGGVSRKSFPDLEAEIKKDFGLVRYGEKFIYGQFYRSEAGTHTFVRLLPDKVDSFDKQVIDLLKARRLLNGAYFVFGALEALGMLSQGKIDADRDRMRARLLAGWRHAHAIGRAVGFDLMIDDSLPNWSAIKGAVDKSDLAKIAQQLNSIKPDKGGDFSVEGARKAAAVVARTFFALQAILIKTRGELCLTGLGITLKRNGNEEEYRFPVLYEARHVFKEYLDKLMVVRQLRESAKKNGHVMYADALQGVFDRAVSDLEVLEIFGMNLAYVAWAPGYKVNVKQEPEKTLWPDSPPLAGEWEMVERIAQPQDDPDYPGFVVAVWKRGKDFIVTPKGTSSEDGLKCKDEDRTRDQADKVARVSTGVEADGDPSGVAYHATKKYFKRVLLEKMKAHGLAGDSKIVVTGHSLGGAITERLHLKFYEAGFKQVWSMAFSPPALDARTISKALYTDDQMGPAAFDRLAASGGTWDVVTKGGDTGACIPLRILCVRPWDPLAFTPVPFSVCGANAPDMYFLQHGTMFQHECKTSGFRIFQTRTLAGHVVEDTDKSYNVYDYCKDVTVGMMEATRNPWSMEHMLAADAQEKSIRQEFGRKVGTDADRAAKGSVAKFTRQVMVLADLEQHEFKSEEIRLALDGQLIDRGEKASTQVRTFYVKGEDELLKKLKDATWATGCILSPGKHFGSEKLRDAIKELKFKVVEVHMAQVDAGQDKIAAVAAKRLASGVYGFAEAMDWLATQMQ